MRDLSIQTHLKLNKKISNIFWSKVYEQLVWISSPYSIHLETLEAHVSLWIGVVDWWYPIIKRKKVAINSSYFTF